MEGEEDTEIWLNLTTPGSRDHFSDTELAPSTPKIIDILCVHHFLALTTHLAYLCYFHMPIPLRGFKNYL